MDGNRKRTREIQVEDRISELPDSVIEHILDYLPIRDVVRTSILSRKWRYHWTRVGNLVFDEKFAYEIEISHEPFDLSDYELSRYAYIDTVCSLLLLLNGPINKFVMHLPRFNFGNTIDEVVCKWMHALSRHGVKEFTLDATEVPTLLTLPSYIFDCLEMRRLALHNCKVRLPFNFRGFKNLISLHLDKVWISKDALNTLISNCPLLEKLFLKCFYGGFLSVSVCALNLRTLELEFMDSGFTEVSLQNVPNLVTLYIRDFQPALVDEHTFTNFFGAIPKISDLTFGGETLMGWGWYGYPKMLPTPLDCLKSLTILRLNLVEPKQMYGALCILRSSPNLQSLKLSLLPSGNEADTVAFLYNLFRKPKYFPSSLLTATIKRLMGSRSQIMLPKFILTSCPSLEMLNLNVDATINEDAELHMMAELMECRRASSKAKITYVKGRGKFAKRYSTGYADASIFRF